MERWNGGKVERWKGGIVERWNGGTLIIMEEHIKSYKDLEVWKVSMELATLVYDVTKKLPDEEKYGLSSQIRRAVISVPSNIAEGASRKNTKEFIHYLYISNGSLSELETQIELAERLTYIEHSDKIFQKIKHIRKMLMNLIKALKNKARSDL